MFKDITGYDGYYQINEDGIIKNKYGKYLAQHKMLITKPGNLPYKQVTLTKNYERKSCMVHRLVAQEFVPNDDPEHKTIVMHKDNDCQNNKASNLQWGTLKENAQQCARDGRNYIPTKGNITTYIYILYNPTTQHTIFVNGVARLAEIIGAKKSMIHHYLEGPNNGYIRKGPFTGYTIYRSNIRIIADQQGNILYTT